MNKYKTKFLNRNGYDSERKRAAEVFNTTDEYEIIGGIVYSSSSYYMFKGIPGEWNTVMFSTRWEDVEEILSIGYL
jgi:predicted small integral membrane protein